MQKDKIISALIGLIGACSNNPKTDNTDQVVIKALAFPCNCTETDDASIQKIIEEIYAEKNIIAPGCALCTMPCGNTSDYDMDRIYRAEEDVRKAKLCILKSLQNIAGILCRRSYNAAETDAADFLYKALFYVSYDTTQGDLLSVLSEAEEIEKRLIH